MPIFTLNGRRISLEDLQSLSTEISFTEFEKSTLAFCKAWLSGQKEFSLKTSGSTGPPKSIALQRWQMEASAKQTIEALQLKAGETALVCLDTRYIAGQMMLVRSLLSHMNIVAVEPSSNPFANLENQSIDFVALVPLQLEKIINDCSEKLDQVRCAIVGGASISSSLKEKIKLSECALYATYGMTETISHIALQKLNGQGAGDYFQAFDNIDLSLNDRSCLCIKANYLSEEIITNDLVELIGQNKFKWLGRVDNVINSGGIKIIAEKVESVLEKIFFDLDIKNRFFVAGRADESLGNSVTVYVEGHLNSELQKKILLLSTPLLSKYEIPKGFELAERFHETITGKVIRKA